MCVRFTHVVCSFVLLPHILFYGNTKLPINSITDEQSNCFQSLATVCSDAENILYLFFSELCTISVRYILRGAIVGYVEVQL